VANPRCYACEWIVDGAHNKDTYLRPNSKNM
jgi:hypothetical protein